MTRVIDAVIERGECDFATEIAVPVPLGVLAELMGVPDEDLPRLYEWTEQIEEAQRSPEPAAATRDLRRDGAATCRSRSRLSSRAAARAWSPSSGAPRSTARSSTDPEILVFFGLLVFAGNDTTRNTPRPGCSPCSSTPSSCATLRGEPEAIPQAVEEILRFTTRRQLLRPHRDSGHRDRRPADRRGREGAALVRVGARATRPSTRIPQRFDVTRAEHSHKAFGGGGRHFCLGAGLARLELRVIFEEITRRMPDLALDGEVTRLPSSWAQGLTSMPVRFTPGARESA